MLIKIAQLIYLILVYLRNSYNHCSQSSLKAGGLIFSLVNTPFDNRNAKINMNRHTRIIPKNN